MPLILNFGRNIFIRPKAVSRPSNIEEVLVILEQCAREGTRVRCSGALHSWSPIADTQGLLLDLRRLDWVQYLPGPQPRVRVGGGCTLKRLLRKLRCHGVTLPTLGAIKKQTVAGAVATGTHGTGKPSLSEFVESIALAVVDRNGTASKKTLDRNSGEDFLAARCALGTMGVVVELELAVVPPYRVKETIRKYRTIEAALEGWRGRSWPLTQFALIPWSWLYLVYRRKVSAADGFWLRLQAPLCRLWTWLAQDIGMHLLLLGVLCCARRRRDEGVIRGFFEKRLPKLINLCPRRVDDSEAILTGRHDHFTHVEMELFIPETQLIPAVRKILEIIKIAGGERQDCEEDYKGLRRKVEELRGTYTLHYPLFFRRIETDETLVSMSSPGRDGDGDWVSVSFFSYRGAPSNYNEFCGLIARCMMDQHDARLHWGKFLPTGIELQRLYDTYPRRAAFEDARGRYDPTGMFRYERP